MVVIVLKMVTTSTAAAQLSTLDQLANYVNNELILMVNNDKNF